MRILLMLPYNPSWDRLMPDLGLGYLAGYLQKEGHDVDLFIQPNEFPSKDIFTSFIKKGNYDVIGIKVLSAWIKDAITTTELLRKIVPDVTIIVGGAHVSSEPTGVFKFLPEANYAFHSEAEIGLGQFVNLLSSGEVSDDQMEKVPNLVWRKGEQTVVNPIEFADDIDQLPFPAWNLMDPSSFISLPYNTYSRRHPIAPVMLTRGCPAQCTYCEAPRLYGRKIRSRSADNVMEELNLLINKYGVREIQFADANCAHRLGPLREVLKRIIAEEIDITWSAPIGMRLDSVDEELAILMKKSGCFQVNVGIESGSPRILKKIKKGITVDLARKGVAILRNAGIEVVGFMMIGFPGETREEMEQTISLAMELPLTGACFSILTPLPGTDLFKELDISTDIDIDTFTSFDLASYKNEWSEVPYDELKKLRRNAYIKFHIRPHILYYIIKNLNSLNKIKFIAKRVFSY